MIRPLAELNKRPSSPRPLLPKRGEGEPENCNFKVPLPNWATVYTEALIISFDGTDPPKSPYVRWTGYANKRGT
jgi:hypothetical protein